MEDTRKIYPSKRLKYFEANYPNSRRKLTFQEKETRDKSKGILKFQNFTPIENFLSETIVITIDLGKLDD